MTSRAQINANRDNALQSTGPRTPAGKGRSSKNALCHGLRAEVPVLPGESPKEWEAHRAGILQSLSPSGALEEALAGRVALCLWRLRRVAAYETAVTVVSLDEVPDVVRGDAPSLLEQTDHQQLAKVLKELAMNQKTLQTWGGTLRLLEGLPEMPDDIPVVGGDAYGALEDVHGALPGAAQDYIDIEDDQFLVGLGVPREELDEPYGWTGWNAGMVRQAIAQMGRDFKTSPERVLARALKDRQEIQDKAKEEVRRLEREAKDLRRRIREREDRLRQRRMLPTGDILERVARYEAHLARQMLQALHELQRLQAARAGQPVPVPAVLDVTLNAPENASTTLEAALRG
jgi:hypothetical protein